MIKGIEIQKTKKVTVRMPGVLKNELPKQVLESGYNMREKSKWVAEAVVRLIERNDWEGALLSEVITKTDSQDVFSIPASVIIALDNEVRRLAPNLSIQANRSSIIRAAINRRLLGF